MKLIKLIIRLYSSFKNKKCSSLFWLRYLIGINLFKLFQIKTDELLNNNNYGKLIKKYEETTFEVKPTGNKTADKHFKKTFGKYKIKGQFLYSLKNCYLVTDWSIPVTSDGKIILATSGNLGTIVQNIMLRSKIKFLPEYIFIGFLLLVRLSNFLNLKVLPRTNIYNSFFHFACRGGIASDKTTIAHWIFEKLPQVRIYFEALKFDNKLQLFVGHDLADFQELILDLLKVKKENILLKQFLIQYM